MFLSSKEINIHVDCRFYIVGNRTKGPTLLPSRPFGHITDDK